MNSVAEHVLLAAELDGRRKPDAYRLSWEEVHALHQAIRKGPPLDRPISYVLHPYPLGGFNLRGMLDSYLEARGRRWE